MYVIPFLTAGSDPFPKITIKFEKWKISNCPSSPHKMRITAPPLENCGSHETIVDKKKGLTLSICPKNNKKKIEQLCYFIAPMRADIRQKYILIFGSWGRSHRYLNSIKCGKFLPTHWSDFDKFQHTGHLFRNGVRNMELRPCHWRGDRVGLGCSRYAIMK